MPRHAKGKGFTAKQSRRTSQRMQQGQVGTHVSRPSVRAQGRGMNAGSVRFSSARKQSRAVHGEVNVIMPRAGESKADYARRMSSSRAASAANVQRKSGISRIAVIVVIVAIVVVAAVAAGVAAYLGSTSSSLALRDSDAKEALATVSNPATEPYYVLVSAELGAVAQPLENGGPDLIELVRVDESAGKVSIVNLPRELQVSSGADSACLSEAADGSDAGLIREVESLTGVSVGHFVKTDEAGIAKLVDTLGGVDVDVAQEVDDPNAGSVYIPAGPATLDGKAAIVYLRASNFADGITTRMNDQNQLTAALFEKMFSGDGKVSFASELDSLSGCFQTDFSSNDLIDLNDRMGHVAASDMVLAVTPGYTSVPDAVVSNETYYVASSAGLAALMSSIEEDGTAPADVAGSQAADPSSFTIEVQNGTSIAGAASATAQSLTQRGFRVESSGNAEQAIYSETLVIYDGDEGQERAQAVVNALGFGRTVRGQGYYSYSTDVLVIIGADYKPTS